DVGLRQRSRLDAATRSDGVAWPDERKSAHPGAEPRGLQKYERLQCLPGGRKQRSGRLQLGQFVQRQNQRRLLRQALLARSRSTGLNCLKKMTYSLVVIN